MQLCSHSARRSSLRYRDTLSVAGTSSPSPDHCNILAVLLYTNVVQCYKMAVHTGSLRPTGCHEQQACYDERAPCTASLFIRLFQDFDLFRKTGPARDWSCTSSMEVSMLASQSSSTLPQWPTNTKNSSTVTPTATCQARVARVNITPAGHSHEVISLRPQRL